MQQEWGLTILIHSSDEVQVNITNKLLYMYCTLKYSTIINVTNHIMLEKENNALSPSLVTFNFHQCSSLYYIMFFPNFIF